MTKAEQKPEDNQSERKAEFRLFAVKIYCALLAVPREDGRDCTELAKVAVEQARTLQKILDKEKDGQ